MVTETRPRRRLRGCWWSIPLILAAAIWASALDFSTIRAWSDLMNSTHSSTAVCIDATSWNELKGGNKDRMPSFGSSCFSNNWTVIYPSGLPVVKFDDPSGFKPDFYTHNGGVADEHDADGADDGAAVETTTEREIDEDPARYMRAAENDDDLLEITGEEEEGGDGEDEQEEPNLRLAADAAHEQQERQAEERAAAESEFEELVREAAGADQEEGAGESPEPSHAPAPAPSQRPSPKPQQQRRSNNQNKKRASKRRAASDRKRTSQSGSELRG